MDIQISPSRLSGSVSVPPSKSISHRALICAALAEGESRIENMLECEDTAATVDALTALGAHIKKENGAVIVRGIQTPASKAEIDCRESGSTLRFLLPVAAALGTESAFYGRAKLPERPITPYFTEFERHGVRFSEKKMPYRIEGRLTGGTYEIDGNISSQFITGLLLALPLLSEDCVVRVKPPVESKPYIDLTADVMRRFGIVVREDGNDYFIAGGQRYCPAGYTVESDLSQAAFFAVANAIGANLRIEGVNPDTRQGDRAILEITECFSENGAAFDFDASQTPDLVPILTVLACFAKGISHITGCGRLHIKECDRLEVISSELNRLGAKITAKPDALVIEGVGTLHGGVCDSHTDHRIPMALAIAAASQHCTEKVILRGAECVSKSYPNFFADLKELGGKVDVI